MTTTDTVELEKPQDAGKGQQGVYARWKREIEAAGKAEEKWRRSAQEAVNIFRAEKIEAEVANLRAPDVDFNILWSNTEVLAPALYGQTPQPDIRRRFRDADPLGKKVAEILERACLYALDAQDFDCVMEDAVNDYLLPGRSVTRVRYLPEFDGDGHAEKKVWESVECEHVDWRDFRRGPGRRWDEVPWIAFRHRLTKAQVKGLSSAEKAGQVQYTKETNEQQDEPDDAEKQDIFKRATCWEIWDRQERKEIWIAEAGLDVPLRTRDDPLRLKRFFPIPRPMYAVRTSGSLVPVEEYRLYRRQAEELDRLTRRIDKLVSAIRYRGLYDSRMGNDVANILMAGDNELIPADQVAALVQEGGLDKAIWTLPIDVISQVVDRLYLQREGVKQTIYELTGISDVLRGASDPDETLGAQNLKASFGSQRLKRRQREVQRYARDLIEIMVEIIAEHFDMETLAEMTGVRLPTQAEKAQRIAQMIAAQFQQQTQARPRPPLQAIQGGAQ